MKKLLTSKIAVLTAALLTFLVACKKDAVEQLDLQANKASLKTEPVAVHNGRLVFPNLEAVSSAFKKIYAMKTSDLDSWEKQLGHHSLRKAMQFKTDEGSEIFEKFESFRFPLSLRSIINTNGEYQVGETIYWYHKGKKYIASSEQELTKIKQNPSSSNSYAEVKSEIIPLNTKSARVIQGANVVNAAHQYVFQQVYPVAGERKYVHKLYTYCEKSGYTYYTEATLKIKMEWKGRTGWNGGASEQRRIEYNVTGDCKVNYLAPFGYTSTNTAYGGYNSNGVIIANDIDLPWGWWYVTSFEEPKWDIEIRGRISQHVNGDAWWNAWTNSGNPLY